jgi:outer membrane protein OmpA-like peptidoglycan-associated protein
MWVLVVVAACALPAAAQAGKVLKGKEITESALIDALTPDETVRTRSLRVEGAAGKPIKPASASLLITFGTNSADLTKNAQESLDTVGRALNSDRLADFKFDIEGHADPRGGETYNQRLSLQRAEAVRQYLVQQHHLSPERLEAIGKGDRELLNKKNLIAPENRRVTFKTIVE